MPKIVDWQKYVGQRFGRLVVKSVLSPDVTNKGTRFHCLCDCGKSKDIEPNVILRDEIKHRVVRSCGCLYKESRTTVKRSLAGKRFGRLTAISLNKTKGRNYWNCKCDCGRDTWVFRGSLTKGNTRSCGCYNAEVSASKIGVLNPNWNPSLTDDDRKTRRYCGKNERTWRIAVFRRDDYTCRKCNRRGGTITAHHLDGWNWCKASRNVVDNGVTLCVTCHSLFHTDYGIKNNTRFQFDEFMKETCNAVQIK